MLRNTDTRYGGVTKTLHWITAALIVALIPLGIIANGAPFATSEELAQKAWLFSLHKTLGVTLFFVALTRIAWALTQPKPAGLHPDRLAESFLADLVHWLLYACLLLVPISGWVHHAATTGFAPIWWPFGQSLPFVPKSDSLAETSAALHIIFERVLVASILLHIMGALKHHFIDRDATLKRMLPGQPELPALQTARHSRLPILVAPLVFAGALGIGAALGLFSHDTPAVAAPAATTTETETIGNWAVQDGTLSITVQQLGQAVTGSYATWSADIAYDEATRSGTVAVTIDVSSLSLGSVTAQAMGPEFFDASAHPTSIFTADIADADGQLQAAGTLALRGVEQAVTLPFSLDIQGDTATMTGQITLDRRNFGMGPSYPDESSVGFEVVVDITLTAQKR